MRQRRLPVFALVLLLCALASSASADVPGQLNHEGLLVDASGLPMTGRVLLDLAVYDVPAGGVALWSESYQLDLVDGYYSVTLGLQDDLSWVTGPGDRYLGITVDGPPELAPRRRLLSVPWALVADNAIGDITPRSVSVGGQTVIDAQGNWVGLIPPGGGGGGGGGGFETGDEVLAALIVVDGDRSGLDADLLDGLDSSAFVTTGDEILALLAPVAGSGSELDADRLDGLHASRFMRVDANTGTTGSLSAGRFDVNPGGISGGGRDWMNLGLRVGHSSDNSYFGMLHEGDNNVDTVVAWGDDLGDDLRFIFARSGGPAEGEELLRVTSEGFVGVGTPAPSHRLQVDGSARATTVSAATLQLDGQVDPPPDCAAAEEGTLRYNSTAHELQYCNGTTWTAAAAGGGGGGGGTPSCEVCDGAVSNWRLDDQGFAATDEIGSNNGSLANNPIWRLGKLDGAINFSGNNYIRIPDHDSLEPRQGSFSVSAWIRVMPGQRGQRRIVAHGSHGGGGYDGWSLMQWCAWGGVPCGGMGLIFAARNGGGEYLIGTCFSVDDGNWHHYVATADRQGSLIMYVDGVRLAAPCHGAVSGAAWAGGVPGAISHLAGEDIDCNSDLCLGVSCQAGGRPGLSEYFVGDLDEVAYFNRVLSGADVEQLYNDGTGCQTCAP